MEAERRPRGLEQLNARRTPEERREAGRKAVQARWEKHRAPRPQPPFKARRGRFPVLNYLRGHDPLESIVCGVVAQLEREKNLSLAGRWALSQLTAALKERKG